MIPIVRSFWALLAGLGLLWLAADPTVLQASGVFEWRRVLIQFSGVLAMGCMSVAMILALRPRWPERRLGGLDKIYRLHKWLGIAGLVLAVSHWLAVNGTRWAIGWGLLARPERGARPPAGGPVEAALRQLREPAEFLGEWAFYAVVLLIAVALIRTIPYGLFRRLHRALPAVYLVLVFHAVVLTRIDYWATPFGLVQAVLLAAGSLAAILSLLGRVGAGRKVPGTIAELESFPGVRALLSAIDLGPGWPGHKAGQFAFATSDPREGAHPYTIASAWDPATPRIAFVTKALGDHTARLEQTLKPGQPVTIEGPYGCFTFDDDRPVQIWIGGGIGITPFIARMQYLASAGAPAAQRVHLFHSTAEVDEAALARLRELARTAGIKMTVLIDARDGFLTGDRVRQQVPDWREASLWFCGPAGFGAALRKDFAAQGMDVRRRFHQELFALR